MSTATAMNDDILIIDDSTSDTNEEIIFSFDDQVSDQKDEKKDMSTKVEVKEETALGNDDGIIMDISGDTEPASTEATTENQEVTHVETSNELEASAEPKTVEIDSSEDLDFDLGIDLSEDTSAEQKPEEIVATEDTHEVAADEEFSLGFGGADNAQDDTSVASSDDGSTSDDTSMNDILSATIAQLASRKDAISANIESKKSHESDLKKQIEDLESQVKALEEEMKELNNESSKITANISELEKMKLDPVKEHNSKRAKK